jgi:hypothetical protein
MPVQWRESDNVDAGRVGCKIHGRSRTRTTVQSFLDVRTAVLNDKLEDAFRHRYPGFRSPNDDQVLSEAV